MEEFLRAIAAVIVGSAISHFGVSRTLKRQDERDRKNDERSRRHRKYDRLRTAYRDVVAAADRYSTHTWALSFALLAGQNEGRWGAFNEAVKEPTPNIDEARASLLLEAENDRAVLDKLSEIHRQHLLVFAMLMKDLDEPRTYSSERYIELFESLRATADSLAELARQRLADLEKPVD